jgi:glycogen synthase
VGGVSSHISTISKGLMEKGHQVDILCASLVLKAFTNLLPHALNKIKSGLGTILYFYLIIIIYGIIINTRLVFKSYDIIISEHPLPVISIIRNLSNGKVVQTVHTYLSKELLINGYYNADSYGYRSCRKLEKLSYLRSDMLITVDSRIKDYIKDEYSIDEKRIKVILNSIDVDRFSPASIKEKEILRKSLNLPESNSIILIPRRLDEKCGVIYPALALKEAPPSLRERITLIYVGNGPEKAKIEDIISKNNLNNVMLLGSIPHKSIHSYYKASDIVLIPSINVYGLEEASSISAIEAMACGVPVIASNIGGLKEIITHEMNGLLIPEKDHKAILLSIIRLLDDHRFYDIISNNSRHYALKSFSYKTMVDKYIKEIMEL